MSDDLVLTIEAVLQTGRAVRARFGGGGEVVYKGPDQPLTEADLEADRLLAEALLRERPGYGWLSEETADRPDRLERRRVWIVDPIDGTRSFIKGRPEFAISVGLAEDGEAVLGVVHNPATGELFWALRGQGARGATVGAEERGGKWPAAADVIAAGEPLHVTERSTEDQAVLLASRSEIAAGEFDPFHGGWRVRPTGSTAYKMALIAAGRGDAFLSRGPKSEWDVCAAALLVAEAGGRATDLEGAELRFNREDPYVHGLLATNGRLHDYVLGVVASLPPSPRLRGPGDPLHPPAQQQEE